MVIGNGMVAKRFSGYTGDTDTIIFASGVSNSKTKDEEAYQRETRLLEDTIKNNPDKLLVYFSTCSINDSEEKETKYVKHKLAIEELIRRQVKHFIIFRVSNLVGFSGNPNTILNFFIHHISHKINFDLWINATRNLLDIDDMYLIADHILRNGLFRNEIVNIASPFNYRAEEIVTAIEKHYQLKASYTVINKGNAFNIDTSVIAPVIAKLPVRFETDYLTNLLEKYYK